MTVQYDDADPKLSRTRRLGGRRIYAALKAQISEGLYPPGAAMPSTRALASELGVARTTVTSAYEQLLAEGFLESRQGAPTRVAPLLPVPAEDAGMVRPRSRHRLSAYGERMKTLADRAAPVPVAREPVIDFRYGDLSTADFPTLLWKRALSAAASRRPDRLTYGRPEGSLRLRTALQAYLWRARGIRCDADQIIIVSGSQQGLDLCARILLDPADRFVVENPCYQMARQVFAATGAVPVSVSAREDGLDTARLARTNASLAYVTPSHQFPLGGVMPIARRQQLLAWASATGAYVVEDDYDGEYRYDIKPVPPLYGLRGETSRVIYVGTVSKILSPCLRIGYLIVPEGLKAVFTTAKQLADRHTPTVEQEALASLLEGGLYERHIRRVRRRNGERRRSLLDALDQAFGARIAIQGADAGLHVVVWLCDLPATAEAGLVARARQRGIGLYPVSPLYDPGHPEEAPTCAGLVMGYAALDARQIRQGVGMLAEIVRDMTA
ncbi:PLP-dependent aminotransferase family protein [Komagataeibacter sp. FXV3]|uniref:MocR-like pyridoxine biosynthesis transcription factor PdxR n=1 Tax=Komagataeibacter sp. FXV3 TaxID=2608998 RepID=UPI00187B6A85|nr:PLP-dependent aminotransferase family protein [Komagataeibacter sp. FXV3]MBE7731304.1 PLP-dependent aminotransferase family protein [Komagataeibacter sp. FXV3]